MSAPIGDIEIREHRHYGKFVMVRGYHGDRIMVSRYRTYVEGGSYVHTVRIQALSSYTNTEFVGQETEFEGFARPEGGRYSVSDTWMHMHPQDALAVATAIVALANEADSLNNDEWKDKDKAT